MILFGCVIWVWANVGFAGDMLCILESPNNCRRPMSLERSYVVYIFSLHFTDDTGVYAFFILQMTWEFAFFGYVRLLPRHLQVSYYNPLNDPNRW